MKQSVVGGIIVMALGVWPVSAQAAEHGGQEHGGQEHAGQSAVQPAPAVSPEPTAEQIRQAIRDYIAQIEQEEGAFTIEDDATGTTRTLTLERVHERVGKTGELYYSCTDMRDPQTGEMLDLDFDVEASEPELLVVDVRIHKVNGQPRYTYDEHDSRIPVQAEADGHDDGGGT